LTVVQMNSLVLTVLTFVTFLSSSSQSLSALAGTSQRVRTRSFVGDIEKERIIARRASQDWLDSRPGQSTTDSSGSLLLTRHFGDPESACSATRMPR